MHLMAGYPALAACLPARGFNCDATRSAVELREPRPREGGEKRCGPRATQAKVGSVTCRPAGLPLLGFSQSCRDLTSRAPNPTNPYLKECQTPIYSLNRGSNAHTYTVWNVKRHCIHCNVGRLSVMKITEFWWKSSRAQGDCR